MFVVNLILLLLSFLIINISICGNNIILEETYESKHYHHFVFYNNTADSINDIKENEYLVPNIVHFVCLDDGDLPLYAFLHILGALANFHGSVYFH